MKSVVVAVSVVSVLAVGACHDPPIPLSANTTRACEDGTVCAEWLDCPSLANPGRCGGYSDPTAQWGVKKPDAGVP